MICGGDVQVAFQCFSGGDTDAIALFTAIVEQRERDEDAWIITAFSQSGTRTGLYLSLIHI